jgi:hypothetical protein
LSLNKIDFSDGIRPEEIQENFEMLQQQLNRERLGVGGYGIASGFDITPIVNANEFAIQISSASVIDESGAELFIPACKINIDPPELYTALEHRTINYNNTISLNQIPYATNRRMPAEYLTNKDPRVSGIYINYPANNYNVDDYIRVSDIKGTVLTVTGAISKEVVVRYNYTADRIDTVYLKNDNTIAVIKGTTSTTPSKPYMPNDGKLLIAYLMIEHQYVDDNILIPSANVYLKEDMRSLRNLYTDADNNLYICGTPFDDLQIVHMKEPKNPKPNTLWLNTEENTLYYWKSTDGFVYTNKIIIDTDFMTNDNANRDFATYMDFLLNENELEIYHNGNRIVKDLHYYELYNELPTYNQNIPSKTEGNSFRIIEDSTSGNGLTLKVGDEIMYMIRYKDSHYMWVPVNKMTYLNAKNHRVYCTNDYMPDNKNGYFDSPIANAMGEFVADNESIPYEYKYQYFFFHREKDLDMLFTPGRNELSIHINQMVLHSDQFEEITVYDLYGKDANGNEVFDKVPQSVANAAAVYYDWTKLELEKMINDYDNTGIGFKLVEPLDCGLNANAHNYTEPDGSADLYVEAIVERRVCCSPVKRKLQRTATFVKEDIIIVDEELINNEKPEFNNIIYLPEGLYYRYNEDQLEVFVNGIKLNKPAVFDKRPELIEQFGYYFQSGQDGVDDILVRPMEMDIIEADELEEYESHATYNDYTGDEGYFERKRAAVCTMFKINRPLKIGDVITYRISTNIYSYDHINNLLDDLEARLETGSESVLNAYLGIKEFNDAIEARVQEVEDRMDALNNDVVEDRDESYFDPYGVLSMDNMPPTLLQTMITSLQHINTSVTYREGQLEYPVNDIRSHDYLTVVRRDVNGFDHFMIPGKDYSVEHRMDYDVVWRGTTFNVLDNNGWTDKDVIYITGLKLSYGKAGR